MSRLFPSSTLNSVLSICPSAATEALSPDLLRFETHEWIQILENCEKVGGRRISSWFVIYLLSFSCQSVSTRSKLNTFPWSLARWSASRRSSSWLDLGSYSDSFGFLSRWHVSLSSHVKPSADESPVYSLDSASRLLSYVRRTRFNKRSAFCNGCETFVQQMLPSKHIAGQWVHVSSGVHTLVGIWEMKSCCVFVFFNSDGFWLSELTWKCWRRSR